ncbi:shikimate kinase [Clostridium sp. CTA-19]
MKNVILIGMSLSGKSTLGFKVAERIGYRFLDTDKAISKNENMTIEDIFKIKGENYFRRLESEFINKIPKNQSLLISTGGGMPIYNNNLYKLKEKGKVVFLNVPIDLLLSRAKHTKDRPLLRGDYKEKMHKLYNQRKNIYNKADIIVNLGENIDENLNELINKLRLG